MQTALKGKTVGVQVSTTHANFASKYLKDVATVKEYKTTDERDLDLKNGRIDVGLDDYPTVAATLDNPDAKDLTIVGPEIIGDVFGVGEAMASAHGRGPDRQVRQGDRRRLQGRVDKEILAQVVQDRHHAVTA